MSQFDIVNKGKEEKKMYWILFDSKPISLFDFIKFDLTTFFLLLQTSSPKLIKIWDKKGRLQDVFYALCTSKSRLKYIFIVLLDFSIKKKIEAKKNREENFLFDVINFICIRIVLNIFIYQTHFEWNNFSHVTILTPCKTAILLYWHEILYKHFLKEYF